MPFDFHVTCTVECIGSVCSICLLVFRSFFACLLSLTRQIEGGVTTKSPDTHHSLSRIMRICLGIYGKIGKTVIMHIVGHFVVFLSFPVSFTPTEDVLILSTL